MDSVAGLGVDIVEIARMEEILTRTPSFPKRVFTQAEQDYCEAHHKPAVHYATHFAAKEAVLKALGTGFGYGIGLTDVEVTHNEKGAPQAILHGRAKEIAAEQGVLEMHISLSRTHGTAVANAIAINEASKVRKEKQHGPREELAASFKELRGMLDELEQRIPVADMDDPSEQSEPEDESQQEVQA